MTSDMPRPSSYTPIYVVLLLVFAVVLPLVLQAYGKDYYISMVSRIMIYGIAACSLNLLIGYGGLVSFGHSAYFGLGAYAVGILIAEGVTNGWVGFAVAMAVSALAAGLIGAISLRTRGVYFIMITLAFAQMIYYLVNSIKAYGGDEGLNIKQRSDFGYGLDL
jgi:branched-chain amino acid transport system permease protein